MITLPTRGRIAIVDDNDLERVIIRRVLAMSELENPVVEFSSAPSFLEELDQGSSAHETVLCLVLMDINMPGMTGFDALPRIRRDRGRDDLLIAIMVASDEAHDDVKRALDLGADLCIAKQSGIEKFVAEITANFRPAAAV